MRILVVDDSKLSRGMTLRALPAEATAIEATNGAEAVEAFLTHRPDLVVMDLTMPVLDGYGALEQIRGIDKSAQVVIVTADVQPGARRRCAELGAVALLAKPVRSEWLRKVVDAIVSAR